MEYNQEWVISICIPQFNRIEVLLKNLRYISLQSYNHIEVCISDDCSTDTTQAEIMALQPHYKYPIAYHRFTENQGYDRNLRKSIEIASGQYCIIVGNDDTIYGEDSISSMTDFLKANGMPDIGYCNYLQGETEKVLITRALETKVQGSGIDCALKHVNGFSFVGGIILKRQTFLTYNTSQYDGSIYSQMYLGLFMVAKGCTLFTIQTPMVLKDLQFNDGSLSWSPVKSGLPTTWKEARKIKSGLLSVLHVLIAACRDAKVGNQDYVYRIMQRMYSVTFPYWIFQYKHNGNHITSMGLIAEMNPVNNPHFREMSLFSRAGIVTIYTFASLGALIIPFSLFTRIQPLLYKWVRK